MKNSIIIIIIVAILCYSCSTSSKINGGGSRIIGTWCLLNTNEINYPTIIFRADSFAIFHSKMDTVYRFKYFVQENYLHLIQPNREIKKDMILKITQDSLIFSTLLEHKKKQVYYRCKK